MSIIMLSTFRIPCVYWDLEKINVQVFKDKIYKIQIWIQLM